MKKLIKNPSVITNMEIIDKYDFASIAKGLDVVDAYELYTTP